MRIVDADEVQWQPMAAHIRAGGGLKLKKLLKGTPGTKENYLCNIAKNEGDYGSPRHRHNFDQIRIALDGDMRISPRQVVKEGQIGYFPEGTYYGPYDDAGRERTIMIVQFGGASGAGYVSEEEAAAAKSELLKEGEFRDGIFRRASGTGKKNQDAFEAVWERCMGRKLRYPEPRYDAPIVLDPQHFAWRSSGMTGVSFKRLGTFTERETRLDMVRLEPGAEWTSQAENAIQILFVRDGAGTCAGQGYGRWTAVETTAGERATFRATESTEIIALVMPLLDAATADAERTAA